MILKIANKQFKQPIELSIPDSQWEQIQALGSQDKINNVVNSIVTKHVLKHGYTMGFCDERKTTVTLSDCMNCGISKGWGKGAENITRWEECKHNHINYDFSPAKVLSNTIKDTRIAAKLNDQTEAEARRDRQTFAESGRDARNVDDFEKASDDVMKVIKNKENNVN